MIIRKYRYSKKNIVEKILFLVRKKLFKKNIIEI